MAHQLPAGLVVEPDSDGYAENVYASISNPVRSAAAQTPGTDVRDTRSTGMSALRPWSSPA